jgi:BirA family transcriptional regulator, biotin operon repressor / biotin---[acetyl-CoA-carboxylase] ligase
LESTRSSEDEQALLRLLSFRNFRRLRIEDPIVLQSVDSTQLYALEKVDNSHEGSLVLSHVQTAGRGRENRSWISQKGGLWLTLVLVPPIPEILSEIPSIATKVIVTTLEQFGLSDCTIKLPNDVYCKGKKIAGVLVDASLTGPRSIAYLGVGINLNNDPSLIAEISQVATSFKLLTGRDINIIEFAANFLNNLDSLYSKEVSRSV